MQSTYDHATSNRLMSTMFVTQSLFSASQIAIFTLLAIVATRLSGTEGAAGLPSSVQTFSQAVAAYPVGLLMGRFGRRVGLTLGYGSGVLGAFVGILAITAQSFPLLLISAMCIGAGRAGSDQSRFAAGELYPENRRARMIGRIVFAGTIGAIGGPALVAPSQTLVTQLGLDPQTGPWAIGLLFYGIATTITFFLLRPDPMAVARAIADGEAKAKNELPDIPTRPLRELLRLPNVQLGILAMLISQTVMVVLMVMTPLHMDHLHHDSGAISMVISAHTLGMFGLSALTGYLIDRFGRKTMLIAGAAILISSAVLAPLSDNQFVLAVALFLLGLGWNFGYVAGSSLLSETLRGAERGRVQGVNDMLVAGCAAVGSLSAGPLFATGGYVAVSVMGLLLTVILVGIILRLSPMALRTADAA